MTQHQAFPILINFFEIEICNLLKPIYKDKIIIIIKVFVYFSTKLWIISYVIENIIDHYRVGVFKQL